MSIAEVAPGTLNNYDDRNLVEKYASGFIASEEVNPVYVTNQIQHDLVPQTINPGGVILYRDAPLSPTEMKLGAAIAAGDTSITLSSTKGIAAGETLYIPGHTGANKKPVMYKVTGITSGTVVAVTLLSGSTYGTDKPYATVGATVMVVLPASESLTPARALLTIDEYPERRNTITSSRHPVKIGGVSQQHFYNARETPFERGIQVAVRASRHEIEKVFLYGQPVHPDLLYKGATGIVPTLLAAGENIDAKAEALSLALVNKAMGAMVRRGAPSSSPYAIVVHPDQYRVLTGSREFKSDHHGPTVMGVNSVTAINIEVPGAPLKIVPISSPLLDTSRALILNLDYIRLVGVNPVPVEYRAPPATAPMAGLPIPNSLLRLSELPPDEGVGRTAFTLCVSAYYSFQFFQVKRTHISIENLKPVPA